MIPQQLNNFEISLVLHNIRSTHNVGAIFRTADAAGVRKVYLSGYTPAPVDRFGRARQDISKAALGAELTVPWEALPPKIGGVGALLFPENRQNAANAEDIKVKGTKDFIICAVEQDERSVDFREIRGIIEKSATKKSKPIKIILILGNEVDGLEKEILDICDYVIEVPMLGGKESLNVSVTAGIVLYQFI